MHPPRETDSGDLAGLLGVEVGVTDGVAGLLGSFDIGLFPLRPVEKLIFIRFFCEICGVRV